MTLFKFLERVVELRLIKHMKIEQMKGREIAWLGRVYLLLPGRERTLALKII